MPPFLSVLFICVGLCGVLIHGWGPVGHSLVVRLAETQLNSSEFDWLRSLVPWFLNGNLSSMASWPDVIVNPNTNPIGYQNWIWTKELHYIHIPDWNCTYLPERDCQQDRCAEGAINNYTKRVVAPLSGLIDETQRQEALYFILHFVGDIHQPLHAGFTSDKGATLVKGYFMNETEQTDLHWLWDNDMLMYRLHHHFSSDVDKYFSYLYSLMMNLPSTNEINSDTDYKVWIKEDTEIVCSQIYLDDNNQTFTTSFNLGEPYFERNYAVVDKRVAQAGRRLGILLKSLKPETPYSSCNTVRSSGLVIIIMLSIVNYCHSYKN
ncbi:unnamed protein product [Rotaria socialis]|uniref:Aspergillus nuclease S(1) n=4 Tax=Rotaria socialis TaxID=392032 RepID=A0A818Z726_9BILA|nr:unnamed protein product [Rotaria socialis]CAF3372417.1 unnamed protein product [Rotaria socialis]CAF3532121.1 unnamed protein product [Rotaria socialis]CAF3762965.1 unnamed protein product [Rotaria socialis]CAF4354233.1 unnamed protein product [Rotaria socialis]